MRPRPTALLAFATSTAILLVLAPAASACPPSAVGLEALIARAEQAILVEIVALEAAPAGWLVGKVKPTVTSRVLAHLDADGPRVGATFRWSFDYGSQWGVIPGRYAVVFLDRLLLPWSSYGLTLSGAPDAVLVLAGHQSTAELVATVEAGFAAKREGSVGTDEWLTGALRSPTCRVFLSPLRLTERRSQQVVAAALVTGPTGTSADLVLLRSLRDLPDARLDLLALELAESWLEAGDSHRAKRAARLALARWRIPVPEAFETGIGEVDHQALVKLWRAITDEAALPKVENPHVRAQIAAWQRWDDEATAFYRQRAAADRE